MEKKLTKHIVNVILFLSGLAIFITAQSIETGSVMAQGGDFMPKLLGIIWIGLSILIFFTDLKNLGKMNKVGSGINMKLFMSTLVLIFFYILIIGYLGFILSSVIYLFIQIILIAPGESHSKKTYVIYGVISLISPVLIYLIFANLFFLILPRGIF